MQNGIIEIEKISGFSTFIQGVAIGGKSYFWAFKRLTYAEKKEAVARLLF